MIILMIDLHKIKFRLKYSKDGNIVKPYNYLSIPHKEYVKRIYIKLSIILR